MSEVGAGSGKVFGAGVLRRKDGTVIEFELKADEAPTTDPHDETEEVDDDGNYAQRSRS